MKTVAWLPKDIRTISNLNSLRLNCTDEIGPENFQVL